MSESAYFRTKYELWRKKDKTVSFQSLNKESMVKRSGNRKMNMYNINKWKINPA